MDPKIILQNIKKNIKNPNKEIEKDAIQNAYLRLLIKIEKINKIKESNHKIKYIAKLSQNVHKRTIYNEIKRFSSKQNEIIENTLPAIENYNYIEAENIYNLINEYCQKIATNNEKKYIQEIIINNNDFENYWENYKNDKNIKNKKKKNIPNYIKCKYVGIKTSELTKFKKKFKKYLQKNEIYV
jgi:hypothetical protein